MISSSPRLAETKSRALILLKGIRRFCAMVSVAFLANGILKHAGFEPMVLVLRAYMSSYYKAARLKEN